MLRAITAGLEVVLIVNLSDVVNLTVFLSSLSLLSLTY